MSSFVFSVKFVLDSAEFFVERLYLSMKGAGTDDEALVRLVVSRSEVCSVVLGWKVGERGEEGGRKKCKMSEGRGKV